MEEKLTTKQLIHELLKFQLLILRSFGLYHYRQNHWSVKSFNIIITVIHWICFIKIFFIFKFIRGEYEAFDAKLVYKIITFVWLLCCAIQATLTYVTNEKRTLINELNRLHEEIFEEYQESKSTEQKRLKIAIKLITIFTFSLTLITGVSTFVSLFGPDNFYIAYLPLTSPFQNEIWAKNSVPYKLLCCCLACLSYAAWLLPMGYYLSYCYLTCRLLDNFNKQVKSFRASGALNFGDNCVSFMGENGLKELQKWYLKLECFVKHLDNCFHPFIGIVLISNVPIIFSILYIISDWTGNCVIGLFEVLFPIWLILCFFIIVLVVGAAAKINKKAHESLRDIINISTESYSTNGRIEKNIMIYSIVQHKIGLTVFGYFIIEKPFILTVLSTILGYFLIMTSIQPSKIASCLDS